MTDLEKQLADAAQQAVNPTDPGHAVDVLREHVRHLERRVRQLASQAVPAGYALVPVEPTPEMLEAATRADDEKPLSDWGKVVTLTHEEVWAAMLSAAPPPPNQQSGTTPAKEQPND